MSTVTEIDSTVEGAIKSVTVYRTGKAEIARTYEVKLAEGDNEIRISGLSSHIDQQSVRVSGLGLGARLADVTCTIKKNDPFKPSKALQSLQAKKQRLEAEKLIRQQETEIYLSYAKSVNSEHVPTEQLVPFMHTLVQERQSVLHAMTLLDEQINVVDDAIAEHANNKRAGTIDGHIVLRVYVGSSLRAPASATVSDTQPDESAEPDEAWKKGVKDEIDAQFAPDIALLMDDKAKQIASSATVADQQRVEQEYDAHLMRYVSLANQRFEERLEAERSRRRSLVQQKTGATTSFTLSYIVSKASWSPLYDIHATSQEKETRAPVTLSYRASITQETGETWADATLILSTASDATHSFQIPRLPTYRLQPGFAQGGLFAAHPPAQQAPAPAFTMRQQAPPSRFQFPPQRGGALFGAANPAMPAAQMQQNHMQQAQVQQAAAHVDNTFSAFGTATVLPSQALYSQELAQAESTPVEEEEEELEAPVAKLQTSPVSVSYTVSHPVNIPSDGAAHTVTIATLRLNAEITRVCVPRVDAVTYLQCIILNKSDYQLVAGPVNVFLEDMFVARTSIKDVMPNEGFDCTLGADRGLRVTYERLPGKEQSTDNAPMFGERKYVTKHVARTYITNNHPFRINNLIIRDALPLASSESARVLLRKPAGLADVGAGEKVHVADGIDAEWFRKGKGSKEPIEGKYKWLVSLDGGKGCTLETEWEVQSGSNTKWREVVGSN